MTEYEFDLCAVTCVCCGLRYDTVEYADEIPTICAGCITPNLQVDSREPTEYEPDYAS